MGNKKSVRTMGLDIGTRTIGVAISDELGIAAQGLKTIRRKSIEEDLKDTEGVEIKFPVDEIGAEVFLVPPSADNLPTPIR
jgi:RNase H-fold protein (predicted Holliday junction resolvase)